VKVILTIEITPEIENQFERVGVADFGKYRYVVKSERRLIAEGAVHNPGRAHFSVLLRRIADDAKQREFQRVMSE
jgi:hypothetical protein